MEGPIRGVSSSGIPSTTGWCLAELSFAADMEHSKHIIRAMLVLLTIGIVFIVLRHFAIPKSFGMYGHYRFDSVAELAAKPPVHGNKELCGDCHAEQAELVREGAHQSVSCEVCHAAIGVHIAAGERIAEMPLRRSNALCGWCHQRLAARPASFPQVVFVEHVTGKGGEMVEGICMECHDAHDPIE